MPLPVNTLVWVKLEGYPWWPALVVEPTEGAEVPKGMDTPVVFLYTNDMSYVNSEDSATLVPYGTDPEGDVEKRATDDPQCAEAIQQMDAMLQAAVDSAPPQEDEATAVVVAEEDQDEGDDDGEVGGEDPEERRRRKEEKKRRKAEKKAAKALKRQREEEAEEAARQHKKRHAVRDDDGATRKKKKESAVEKAVRERHEDDEARKASISDPLYERYTGAPAKRAATTVELQRAAAVIQQGKQDRDQDLVLNALSELTKLTVTLRQLKSSKIGVVVGSLLDGTLPYCRLLAQGLLQFWFHSLPKEFRKNLQQDDELQQASIASNEDAGDERPEMSMLHAFGVQVESCFQVEEVDETPGLTDAAHVAGEIDAWLNEKYADEPADETKSFMRLSLLAFLKNMDNTTVRKQLLAKELLVEDFLEKFVRDTEHPNQEVNKNVVTIVNPEEDYENVTHLMTCPQCGAQKATVSEIVKGGYGEEGETLQLVTCIVCHHAWQVG